MKNNKFAVFIATWFYTGLIPPFILKGMAGTYGSFFSLPLVWGALWLSSNVWMGLYWVITVLILLIGLWAVPRAEIALGPRDDWGGNIKTRDQNQIVIDEVFGMLITCHYLCYLQISQLQLWFFLFVGFGFFRFFDIVKIPPTRYFDRMKNATGVMLDDLVAGVYAYLLLGFVIVLFP